MPTSRHRCGDGGSGTSGSLPRSRTVVERSDANPGCPTPCSLLEEGHAGRTVAAGMEGIIAYPSRPFLGPRESGSLNKSRLQPPSLQRQDASTKPSLLALHADPSPGLSIILKQGGLCTRYANHLFNYLREEGEARWHLMSHLI